MLRYLFILLLTFVSCNRSSGPLDEQKLKINIGFDPQTLDPRKARDLQGSTLMHMLFEGLTRTSKTGQTELALAHHVVVSEDGKQYTFSLRKSIWSNGDPVTSFDFAESWRSILNPAFPTDIAYQLYVIKNGRKAKLGEMGVDQIGVQTPDPQTLIVELEQPIPYFLDLLSMTPFFPIPHKIVLANPDWAIQPEQHVCNGPFILKEWKHAEQIRVLKNERYWQAKEVDLKEIDLYMIGSDTEMRMFEEGKLDWSGSPLSTIPIDAVSSLRKSEKLHISPFSGTYFFRLNTADKIKEKKNPFSHPLFRKALSYCLKREAIAEHVLQGGQIPANRLVPPEMGLSEKGYFHDDQPEMARALLTDALLELDLTMEALMPLPVSYCSTERNALIAQALQKQWENGLGIKIELEPLEPKVFFQKLSQKEFYLAAGSWAADFNDPINFLEVFKYKDASTNNTNWESSKYIDLLNLSALCKNQEERKGFLREAEQILMEQMPIIPIFHFALNFLQSDRLEDVALSPLGQIDFRWAHLSPQPSLKKR